MTYQVREKCISILEGYYPNIEIEDLSDEELALMINRAPYRKINEEIEAQLILLNETVIAISADIDNMQKNVTSSYLKIDGNMSRVITSIRRDAAMIKDNVRGMRIKLCRGI